MLNNKDLLLARLPLITFYAKTDFLRKQKKMSDYSDILTRILLVERRLIQPSLSG